MADKKPESKITHDCDGSVSCVADSQNQNQSAGVWPEDRSTGGIGGPEGEAMSTPATDAAHTVGDYESRLPDTATVTVKHTVVDGTVKKRKRGPNKPKTTRDTHHIKVDPRVMAEAKRQCQPHQRIVIVGAEEVWIINKGSSLHLKAAQR